MKSQKMSREEIEQWDSLYVYVKNEILRYDENQSIPPSMVLRLKGLITGKFMANNNIQNKANYSFDIILKTFQICKVQILNAINTKCFNNEMSKFNYICKIVENNINDVYLRLQNASKTKRKVLSADMGILCNDSAEYVAKNTNNQISDRLEKLW